MRTNGARAVNRSEHKQAMQTPSHFLITAVVNRQLSQRGIPVQTWAFLIGSFLPDLPFTLLTLGGEIYYRWFAMLPTSGSIMEYLHFTLFYTDPVWVIGHNVFHSLIINTGLLIVGCIGFRYRKRWGLFVSWLAASMEFHMLIDIFTHHTDGPLFLFPINWSYRFASPISYWEPAYHGRIFTIFEYLLDALILAYFGWQWWQHRRQEALKRYA